jgi:hypothetical protein
VCGKSREIAGEEFTARPVWTQSKSLKRAIDQINRKGGLEYLGVLSRTLNRRSIRRAIQHLENRLE